MLTLGSTNQKGKKNDDARWTNQERHLHRNIHLTCNQPLTLKACVAQLLGWRTTIVKIRVRVPFILRLFIYLFFFLNYLHKVSILQSKLLHNHLIIKFLTRNTCTRNMLLVVQVMLNWELGLGQYCQ